MISTLGKNPEREKVIDFTAAYSPFFQAVFAAKGAGDQEPGRPGRQDRGRDPRRDRGQELTKVAPAGADIKRFEDNNAHRRRPSSSGQMQAIATGASVAGNMMRSNPQLGTEYKLLLKDSPTSSASPRAKTRCAEGQRDHRRGQGQRRDRQDGDEVAGPPGRQPARVSGGDRMFDFGAVLAEWPLLAAGVAWTLGLTAVAAVHRHGAGRGLRLGTRQRAGAGCAAVGRRLCRADPQHALHRAAVLHLLRPAGRGGAAVARGGVDHRDGGQPRRLRDRDRARRAGSHAARPDRGRAAAWRSTAGRSSAASCCRRRCARCGRRW